MKNVLIFLALSALTGPIWARVILHADFESDPLGAYSLVRCKLGFPGVTWDNGLTGESRVSVVTGGDSAGTGHALRVFYPAYSLGPTGTGGALPSGAQWPSIFGGTADTLYTRFGLFFPKSFDWVKGGKLPGLCGSQCNTGGKVPTGTDGWSARLMWRENASLVQYVYSAGQTGTYGTDIAWKLNGKPLVIETGVWHQVQMKICLNTPGTNGGQGKTDGRVMGWYDGVLAIDATGFRFRDLESMHITEFYFSTFFGGGTADFESHQDNRIFFDDFTVSDSFFPSTTTSNLDQKFASSSHFPHGRIIQFDPSFEGLEVRISNLNGQLLAILPIRSGTVTIPQNHLHGMLVATIPERRWMNPIVVP